MSSIAGTIQAVAVRQYHYPFENKEEFDGHRSVDLVSESADQTRGWFYTQHAIDQIPPSSTSRPSARSWSWTRSARTERG